MSLPFDRIEIRQDDGVSELTVEAFRAIQLNRRVRLLLENRITFYRDQTKVKTALALQSLAEQNAS